MRTHQFSTSPGRCMGKGGRPGWRGRGEPSRAQAPGPGPLSTGRAARAWLPGSTAGGTGPWPGAQRPPLGAGRPADRTGKARLSRLPGILSGGWGTDQSPPATGSPVTRSSSPNSNATSITPAPCKDPWACGMKQSLSPFPGASSQVRRLRSG